MASWLNAQGITYVVLKYRMPNGHHEVPLSDAEQAIRLVRQHASEWGVRPDRVGIMGASAGGHLAGMLGVFWNQEWLADRLGTTAETLRPAGLLLSYPVITAMDPEGHLESFRNLLGEEFEKEKERFSLELQVTKDTPPVFLWHTAADESVPVENSFLMAMALKKAGVPVELHIFPEGAHGLSLASPLVERLDGSGLEESCQCWIDLAQAWLKRLCEK